MPYRTTTLAIANDGTVAEASATATTWPTLTAARAAAERHAAERSQQVVWRHEDTTRPTWAVGTATTPSAYRTTVVIAPAATGLDAILDVLTELRAERCAADIRATIRESIEKANRPASSTSANRLQEVTR